jgi:hypothetical protein
MLKTLNISQFRSLGSFTRCILVLCGVILSSCVSVSLRSAIVGRDDAATRTAISRFHTLFNSEKWDDICREAEPGFCAQPDKSSPIICIQHARSYFGEFKRLTFSETSTRLRTPILGSSDEVHAVCNSDFEKGAVTELFIFMRRTGKFHLMGYSSYPGTVRPAP